MRTFKTEPWPGCPYRTLPDGQKQFIADVLDAKLVTPWGMTLTLACERLTNEGKQTRFVWLTNFHLKKSNVDQIANKGGRLRWKIENEGLNVPKNKGYEIKHAYSKHSKGLRTFYILMQIPIP